jgi:hypothetical protein
MDLGMGELPATLDVDTCLFLVVFFLSIHFPTIAPPAVVYPPYRYVAATPLAIVIVYVTVVDVGESTVNRRHSFCSPDWLQLYCLN